MKHRPLLLLLGVLAVQSFLSYQVFTPAPHTGGDNAGYISLAYSVLERGAYLELWTPGEPPHRKYPPVFPLLLAGAMALGVKTWVGLKVIPFLSTLFVGSLAYLWVRNRKGDMFAATVALLLILSDAVLYYSRWILSDPTFLAFSLGALWAIERGSDRGTEREGGWVGAGLFLVLMAYFTRSAGLPLVVAVVSWMTLRRSWKRAAIFSLLFLPLAAFWGWRGAGSGTSGYVPEFWLVDPYRPDLGRVGLPGLGIRIWENLWAYVTDLVPEGMVGLEGPFLPFLGVGVAALVAIGWSRTLKEGPRLGELFFPLYLGLLLLWPQVWSGDRFALPLFPFFILYGASALVWVLGGLRAVARNVLLGGAFLAVALPALRNWALEAEAARECRAVAKETDAWACQGLGVREYVMLADWAGRNLPGGAVVVARKPRIFFVQSGLKAVPLPFTRDPEAFLAIAGDAGAEYLTVDRWDGLSAYYLPPVLSGRPDAFCYLTGVESGGEVGIRLLGIRAGSGVPAPLRRDLPLCPEEMLARGSGSQDPSSKGEIPLLVRRGAGRP